MMWDDAVIASRTSHKPALAFNIDLIDSASIKLAQSIVADKDLQAYINLHFEPAINDFAIDPPVSVGMDSLRNLGQRLSGLEKNYRILLRPTIIMLDTAGIEMDRIVNAHQYTTAQLKTRLGEILAGRNTMAAAIQAFWRDTTSIVLRQNLINMFEERSNYDSVIRHVAVLREVTQYPSVARTASVRYAYLKLQVEGQPAPYKELIASLAKHGEDSVLAFESTQELLGYYSKAKKGDSAGVYYEQIMAMSGRREPDMLNDYAWELANYSHNWEKAKSLVDEAIGKNPNDANYYDTRALVYALLANLDGAIADEQKAVTLAAPDDLADFKEKLEYYQNKKKSVQEAASAEQTPATKNDVEQSKVNGHGSTKPKTTTKTLKSAKQTR